MSVALAAAALATGGCGPTRIAPMPDLEPGDAVVDVPRTDLVAPRDASTDAPRIDVATTDTAPDVATPDVVAAPDAPDAATPDDAPPPDVVITDAGFGVCPATFADGLGRPCPIEGALCDPLRWCVADAGTCDLLRCLAGTWHAYRVTMIDPTTDVFLCPGTPCDPHTHYCLQTGGHLPIVGDSGLPPFSQTCEPLPPECAGTPTCACISPHACPEGLRAYCLDPSPVSPGVSINCAP